MGVGPCGETLGAAVAHGDHAERQACVVRILHKQGEQLSEVLAAQNHISALAVSEVEADDERAVNFGPDGVVLVLPAVDVGEGVVADGYCRRGQIGVNGRLVGGKNLVEGYHSLYSLVI